MLVDSGDTDGAVSRAYYAMLDAAKAALEMVDPQLAVAKTQATIIRRFGQSIIKAGHLDVSYGRTLSATQDFRRAADYERQSVDAEKAREIVDRMDKFLAAVEAFVRSRQP